MSNDGFADIPASLSAQVQRRIAASKDYDMLQGLNYAAIGIGMVVLALTDKVLLMGLAVAVGGGLSESYYRKAFGAARPQRSRTVAAAALAAALAVGVVLAVALNAHLPGRVAWGLVLAAVIMAIGYWAGQRNIGVSPWHVVVLVALAACSLLPLAGMAVGEGTSLLLCGLAIIVMGLVDHVRLLRILGKGATDE